MITATSTPDTAAADLSNSNDLSAATEANTSGPAHDPLSRITAQWVTEFLAQPLDVFCARRAQQFDQAVRPAPIKSTGAGE